MVTAMQAYAATFLLFCAELSAVRQSETPHTLAASFSSLQDGPSATHAGTVPDWTVVVAATCATCIFAEVAVRYRGYDTTCCL